MLVHSACDFNNASENAEININTINKCLKYCSLLVHAY